LPSVPAQTSKSAFSGLSVEVPLCASRLCAELSATNCAVLHARNVQAGQTGSVLRPSSTLCYVSSHEKAGRGRAVDKRQTPVPGLGGCIVGQQPAPKPEMAHLPPEWALAVLAHTRTVIAVLQAFDRHGVRPEGVLRLQVPQAILAWTSDNKSEFGTDNLLKPRYFVFDKGYGTDHFAMHRREWRHFGYRMSRHNPTMLARVEVSHMAALRTPIAVGPMSPAFQKYEWGSRGVAPLFRAEYWQEARGCLRKRRVWLTSPWVS
jgi:hypothetical protein